jgi:hypothetical protein
VLDLQPHEFLAKIAAGHPFEIINVLYKRDDFGDVVDKIERAELVYPTIEQRIDCAKAAAPYYAPKLGNHITEPATSGELINNLLNDLAAKLP